MADFFKKLSEDDKKLIKKSPFPQWNKPMLATLTDKRFSDPNWIYECKFDGERALTYFHQGEVHILSRNQQNLNRTYPDLVEAFKGLKVPSFVVDGEIVAFEGNVTSFSRLQQRLGIREESLKEALKLPVYYYLFDILYLEGFDVRDLPLRARRGLLKEALPYKDPLRLTEGILKEGEEYFKSACKKGWEGVIAKRLEAPYQSRRSPDWLKFKCHKSQELIIIGYTAPQGKRIEFGALLVGYYRQGKLCFGGKVGTGFTAEVLKSLKAKMDKHVSSKPPVSESVREKNVTWLRPVLVGEFDFTEWTQAGKLRHPRFKGLRSDKEAKDVVKEEPQ